MGLIRQIAARLLESHRSVVLTNSKYKNIHKGQTCLIFGNGGSLKYCDFSSFKGYPSIGCSYSLADNRMSALKLTYCVMPDSYSFYYLRKHSYENKIIVNRISPIFKKLIRNNPHTKFFASLTNLYSHLRRPLNLDYFHHFCDKDSGSYDLAGNFSTCAGALDIMIGLAKYIGFSKAVLIGCDYLGSPKLEGHFYSDAIPFYGKDAPEYVDRIKEVAGELDVLVILPNGSSCSAFKTATFEEYFGAPEVYKSNIEIVDEEYLVMMREAALNAEIWL